LAAGGREGGTKCDSEGVPVAGAAVLCSGQKEKRNVRGGEESYGKNDHALEK
jgi:hypothetical protein